MKLFMMLLFFTAALQAQKPFSPAKSDTIVFAGDSITHQCMYTQYVENFLYTRYHDLELHTFTSGVSGDKAIHLLDRFDEDLKFQNPQWVSLLLGMNDAGYKDYSEENFTTYKTDMLKIAERIKGIDAELIILSPTMFDHQQYRLKVAEGNFRFERLNTHKNLNAKLAMYGGWLRAVANDARLNYIDFWSPLNDATAEYRKAEKNFTLIPDSIHPDPSGMAIMAAQMIEYFKGNRTRIPSIKIDTNSKASGNISELNATTTSIQCSVTPKYLPWVITGTGKPGAKPFEYIDDPKLGLQHVLQKYDFNKELLKITGLEKGSYSIFMNDVEVATNLSNIQLTSGIDLSKLQKSPTYHQSLKIAQLNAKRNDEAMRPYRSLQAKMKGRRKKFADQPEKLAEFRKSIQPQLDEYLKLAKKYEKEIHQLAVPEKYKLEIKKN
ncbi:MAG: SGNH/GDSL hydrolase family protein [Lentisphaerales bacterium]|nr:SGNH/GDSL hydrolase family protein [Lentisphaerales bacterium]